MRADASVLVHASCAFVLAEPPKDPLRSLAQTIVELEQKVLSGPMPAVVVRLGYLYGPEQPRPARLPHRVPARASLLGRQAPRRSVPPAP